MGGGGNFFHVNTYKDMNKLSYILLTLTLLFVPSSNYAQEKLEHLKFMGIPIDGKIKQFGKSLEKKGLRYYTKINSNQYIYKGTFAGDEANIYAMYDIKSQIVYGVGVDIKCLSHEIAKDKYNNYVNDYKDKYETDKWDSLLKYYSENQDSLLEHIANGSFKSYNRSLTDSIDTEFRIRISKVILDDNEKEFAKKILDGNVKENTKSLFNAMLGLKFILNSGNIGTIGINYNNNKDGILIFYRDEQNASLIEDKRKEDL